MTAKKAAAKKPVEKKAPAKPAAKKEPAKAKEKEVLAKPANKPEELTAKEKIARYLRKANSDTVVQRKKNGPFRSARTGVIYVPVTIFD